MKLIIAGSRNLYLDSPLTMDTLINYIFQYKFPNEIVSGGARGIDMRGEDFAINNNIKLTVMEAEWEEYGKSAGPIRNKEMAEYADELLLIWDGESRGSANMKEEMLKLNKPVYEVVLRKYNEKS